MENFRNDKVAAPLKLTVLTLEWYLYLNFRNDKVAAPLKQNKLTFGGRGLSIISATIKLRPH